MADPALLRASVDELAEAFRARAVSPVEVAAAVLEQAEATADLGAFVLLDPDRALLAARESERRWQADAALGPLDGVPATVKDLSLVTGWPTRKGAVWTDDAPATEDSPVVSHLRAAGVVLLGKTTTPELGWKGLCDSPLTGDTRNPWDSSRTPGGSSGGAAVAAATGVGVLHVGSDGGGSIRMPSAFCGTFGIKATHAKVPLYPPGGSGLLSHVGPITRTVRDAAHALAVTGRPDWRDVYPTQRDDASWFDDLEAGVAGMRVAYSPAFGRAGVDPEIAAAVEASVGLLESLGAHVTVTDPALPDCREAFLTLWDAALGRLVAGLTDEQRAACDPGLVATYERGRRITAWEFLDADAVRAEVTLALSRLLTEHDVLVSPQLPLTAFPLGSDVADPATQQHWVDWTPFTYPVNLSRHPAATVPVGLSAAGLPMALQVVGAHFAERTVLRVARALEQAAPFPVWPGLR